ncbi:putative protein SICKLE [Helianthus annuus]|uniref:Uncharacterized protein n=3 Tax=Helianthus annuus TaxID=4232 RepID=A0A9K3HE42_HELAN|nr:putative protein SICKLE [Helianthus annuus]
MEDSTQRRERLKAMRLEASKEDATHNKDHSAVSLANPLLESTTNSETEVQMTSRSFSYYTNPMAVYSGNKQRSQVSPQITQNISSTPMYVYILWSMEESTQRREWLKAMRLDASKEDATHNKDHSVVSLANPLLESTTNSETEVQTTSRSFCYYTNPMAAYSGNKQRSQVSPQISQNISSTPSNTI